MQDRATWAAELDQTLMTIMQRGTASPLSDAQFNELALAVFAFQFAFNEPYRRFCERRNKTPATVFHWGEIPAVPTQAFKGVPLCTFPPEQAGVVYVTSGTTQGPERRGRHYVESNALYEASLRPNFTEHVLPDYPLPFSGPVGADLRATVPPALVLFPSAHELPQSSLAHMFDVVVKELAGPGSRYFIRKGHFAVEELVNALAEAERAGTPVMLLGTAFSFVHLLDHLQSQQRNFTLPPGSRIMDTGGYKGRSRAIPQPELYDMYVEWLGVPQTHVVNEYGMTEMGSQFYDNVLKDAIAGGPSTAPPSKRYKVVPPWVRTVVVDPQRLEPVPPGQPGLLRHIDLANRSSVLALQTDDIGRLVPGGFQLIGRAQGADVRGCSLVVEEIVSGAGPM